MPANIFGEWFIHQATIEEATVSTTPDDDDWAPGDAKVEISFDSPTQTVVRCRFMEAPSGASFEAELSGQFDGTAITPDRLFVPFTSVPPSLLDRTADISPTVTHRITNVIHVEDQTTVDPGPFDINHIVDESRGESMVILHLKRVR